MELTRDDYDQLIELCPVLATMAEVNTNYAFESLTESARDELASAIYKSDGSPLREFVRDRRVSELQIDIRSRVHQIVGKSILNDDAAVEAQHQAWKQNKKGDSEEDFRSSKRTRIKRYQELWSSEDDLKGEAQKIDEVVISPKRITDKILVALGLEEYICPPRSSHELRLTRAAQAVREMKILLGSLRPISRYPKSKHANPQKLTASQPQQSAADSIFQDDTPDALLNHRMFLICRGKSRGRILISQHTAEGEVVAQVHDLPGAYRRLIHIAGNHRQADIETLAKIRDTVEILIGYAESDDWQTVKKSEGFARAIAEFDEGLNALAGVKNIHKRELRDAIKPMRVRETGEKRKPLEDSRGRQNPGACALSLKKLLRDGYFEARAHEIEQMSGYFGRDGRVIEQTVLKQTEFFKYFIEMIRRANVNESAFLKPDEVQRMQTEITVLLDRIDQHVFEPYLTYARLIKTYLTEAQNELKEAETELEARGGNGGVARARKPSRATPALASSRRRARDEKGRSDGADKIAYPRQLLVTAYVAAKAEQITERLDYVCEDIAHYKERKNPESLRKTLDTVDEISGIIEDRSIAQSYFPREFNPLWEKLKRFIGQLKVDLACACETADAHLVESERKSPCAPGANGKHKPENEPNKELERIKQNIKTFIHSDMLNFANRLGAFREAASVDDNGNQFVDIVVFDTETTGIPPLARQLLPQHDERRALPEEPAPEEQLQNLPRVLQLSAERVRFVLDRATGHLKPVAKPVDEVSFLAKPPCAISPDSERIHGISSEQLANEKPFESNLDRLAQLFDGAHGVCGHNVLFDIRMLMIEAAHANGVDPDTYLHELPIPEFMPHAVYDTAVAGRPVCQIVNPKTGLYKMPTLPELHTCLTGKTFSHGHDATADTQATTRCLRRLIRLGAITIGSPQIKLPR